MPKLSICHHSEGIIHGVFLHIFESELRNTVNNPLLFFNLQKNKGLFPPCTCGYNLSPSQSKEFWEAVEYSEQQLLLMHETNCEMKFVEESKLISFSLMYISL